jgi:DNA ligase (NAD+)
MIEYLTIPKLCPVCGASTKIIESASGVLNLFCSNENCSGKLISRLENFAGKKGLDIKGLSRATLEKFIDWGWVASAADLYTLAMRTKEWKAKPGFGEKSVEKILDAIEASRYPTLEAFISALGIPGVGRTLSKEIAKFFSSYEEFRNAAQSKWDFTKIDKIGYEIASNIWNFDFAEADLVDAYMLAYSTPESPISAEQTLAGHKIAITGSLHLSKNRNEFQALIEAHGGKVVTSVTKSTTLLVNNDIKSTSSKNVSAERLGIPILTEDEFWNLYLEN